MAADVLFLEYPKCSTCQKAKKWLDAHGVTYADRHIVEDNPTADELRTWHERSGLPLKRFFNTSGMLYREMELSKKLPEICCCFISDFSLTNSEIDVIITSLSIMPLS